MNELLIVFDHLKIRNRFNKLDAWFTQPIAIPIILFMIAVASYGLLINHLGYYWDDFPLTYIKNVYGPSGLEQYFSTNRPFWGYLYELTFRLFTRPWHWQVNALIWRWLSAVIVWLLCKTIWPDQKNLALWVSILFLIYPGFTQQHISVIYSNLFIVMCCFLSSLYLNMKAIRDQASSGSIWKVKLLYVIALMLSLYNLLALEYFYALELIRPFLIFITLHGKYANRPKRVKATILLWLPFLIVWIGVTIWRVFFFTYQTHNYQMSFFYALASAPLQALFSLIKAIVGSIWVVLVGAWTKIFIFPDVTHLGLRTSIATIIITLFSLVFMVWFFHKTREKAPLHGPYKQIIVVGLLACLFAGVPWWLVELPPTLNFPSDRFTLPFIFGVCLIIVGIVGLFPFGSWMKFSIIGILAGFAIGSHFQVVNQFRRDWETQKRFFWQLSWRIPALEHGTTLMVNDLPVTYYSDNSLTAPLNWFWAPQNTSQKMSFLLVYPSRRLGNSLKSIAPGLPIEVDYLAAQFKGNTSQTVSIFYSPPACLRVLDPALDSDNRMLPVEMQSAATLSSTDWIEPTIVNFGRILPENLYGREPEHGWCYFFEMANIARQLGNWEDVAELGNLAYALNDYPNDPSEHLVYIEGYAHVGEWDRASDLTEQSLNVTPLMEPVLCRLWQRIDLSTVDEQKKDSNIKDIYSSLNCQ